MSEREDVEAILRDRKLKIEDKVAAIMAYYEGEEFDTVEIKNARMPVETVEAYGLSIEVDANGRASTVRTPGMFLIG